MRVPLLVFPVGIFRVLAIPEWAAAANLWNRSEVVDGRRRTGAPLQSPGIPGIASRRFAAEVRPKQVGNENHNGGGLEEHANGHDEIQGVPAAPGLVGIDSARHSEKAGNVHEIEGEVESDEEEPEVEFTERL